jgi:WD40 repeat protein
MQIAAAGVSSTVLIDAQAQQKAAHAQKGRQNEKPWITVSSEPICSMDVATVGLGMPESAQPGEIQHRRLDRVVLWEAQSGKLEHELDGSIRSFCCAFSPDGKSIAAGRDSGVRIWQTGTGGEHGNLVSPNHGRVRSLAFDPKGEFLYTADGRLCKWMWHDNPLKSRVIEDVRGGMELISRVAHAQTVDAIYSTADDRLELREASGKIVKRVARPCAFIRVLCERRVSISSVRRLVALAS